MSRLRCQAARPRSTSSPQPPTAGATECIAPEARGRRALGPLTRCRKSVGKLSRWVATVVAPRVAIHGPRHPKYWPLKRGHSFVSR
jgi:hypothetical protein